MGVVVGAHRAQTAHLMVGEFFVGVAMLGAEDTSGTRVASRGADSFDFDAMSQALTLIAPTGQAGMHERGTHRGHGSKPAASPLESISSSSRIAARNAIHGP